LAGVAKWRRVTTSPARYANLQAKRSGTPLEDGERMPDGVGSAQRAHTHSPPAQTPREVVLFAFGLAASAALVVLTARVLLVVFAGVLFAVVLRAVAGFGARRLRVPYKAALAVCVVMLAVGTGLGFFFALPAITAQLMELGKGLPSTIQRLSQTLHLPIPSGVQPENIASNIEKFATHAVTVMSASVEVFGAFVVLFFVGVYGAADPEAYSKVLLWFVPSPKKRVVRRIATVTTENLERWLLGRLVAMAFVGVASGIAFVVLHVPLAVPLALLAGLLTFVEYVGAFASAAPPILLALSESPARALWVAVVFFALHVIEGYVLTPLLAKTAVKFPPATTLASQGVLSALLGPLGLTFATPLMVVIVTSAQEWRKHT
jgi:predicted PurR-regulated permease PerM